MEENDVFPILNQQIDHFDLNSLFRALDQNQVDLMKLLYVGSQKQISCSTLCEEVKPIHDTIVSAIVTLNLGLLIPSSPLPSYYRKGMDKGEIDEESFTAFIQFLNHHVIKNTVKFSWIEKFFFHDYQALKMASLSMMGLDSICNIHWLFSLYFPELELNVSKCEKEQRMNSSEFSLGVSRLGDKNAFGGYVKRKIRGYSVAFRSDTAQTETRIFWPTEIRNRLRECIFPLIKKTHIYLIINLTIDQYKRATYLNHQNFLGFTSLGETTSNFTWSLFEG